VTQGIQLDIQAMRVAAGKFKGDHDFRNFCKMDADNVHNYRREILQFEIIPVDG
jgi:tRNA pseudouridine38/39 synthase